MRIDPRVCEQSSSSFVDVKHEEAEILFATHSIPHPANRQDQRCRKESHMGSSSHPDG